MKKLSERGTATVVLIIVIILSTIAVIVINSVQETHSQQWQEELNVQVEE